MPNRSIGRVFLVLLLLPLSLAIDLATPRSAEAQLVYARARLPLTYTEDTINADVAAEAQPPAPDGTRNMSILTRQGLSIVAHAVQISPMDIVTIQSMSSVLSPGEDTGPGCGVPNDTFGIVGLRGGVTSHALSCDDFIGRYSTLGNPDIFSNADWNILPRNNVPTDEGMMDTVFAEQFRPGWANGSAWAMIPGFDINVRIAVAACETSVSAIICRRILSPPSGESTMIPYDARDDALGSGAYIGVASGFGSRSDTILRYDLVSPTPPTIVVDQTDVPFGDLEALGPISGAAFGDGISAYRSIGATSGLQSLSVEFEGLLARRGTAGDSISGFVDTSFATPTAFGPPRADGSTVAFDALLNTLGEPPPSKRGTFVLELPINFGGGAFTGAAGGPPPLPNAIPLILPGEVLPDGTVRNAGLRAVAGDVVISFVEYEEGGGDLYAVYPVPEPHGIGFGVFGLSLLARRRRGPARLGAVGASA